MNALKELKSLLNNKEDELSFQQWIEENPTALGGDNTSFSEVTLGSEFRLDFASVVTGTAGMHWKIFEIKRPQARIFKANGRFTSAVSDAIHQAEQYKGWIAENLDYSRKKMPQIYKPKITIIIGRREDLESGHLGVLKQFNTESAAQIRTYDFLLDNIRNFGGLNQMYVSRARAVLKMLPHLGSRVCPAKLRT